MPEKVAELKRLFDLEATKYNVFPLDDRKAERSNPDIAGRPQVVQGNTQLLFSACAGCPKPGNQCQEQVAFGDGRSGDSGVEGVIAAHGGHIGGWSLYLHEGKLKSITFSACSAPR